MEAPRSHHIVLFTTAMVCAMMALSLFLFVLYILPYVLFGFVYNVPEYIVTLSAQYQETGGLTLLLVLAPFLTASIILGFIARRITRNLEHLELDPTLEPDQLEAEFEAEKFHFSFLSLGGAGWEIALIVAVVGLLFLAEYLIFVDLLD